DVPVHTFDPFALVETIDLSRLDVSGKTAEAGETPRGNRGTFAGAMGLLYRRSQGELPINFASPRQPKPPAKGNYRFVRLAAVAAITFFVGLVVVGRVLHAGWAEELARAEADAALVDQKLAQTRENAKRLKDIDNVEGPVWLDDLYELNARIPDVNAL